MKNTRFSMKLVIFLTALSSIFAAITIQAAAGDLDTTFGGTGKEFFGVGGGEDYANAVARQTDGKLIVVGRSVNGDGISGFSIMRYNSNGTRDTTFGYFGRTGVFIGEESGANAVAILSDGKILVAGYTVITASNGVKFYNFALVKYLVGGTLDTTFGNGSGVVITETDSGGNHLGKANAVTVQTDGKIILAGGGLTYLNENPAASGYAALIRYTSNGALDTSFNSDGILPLGFSYPGYASSILTLSGKIYFVVNHKNINYQSQMNSMLVCLNSDGSPNTSFGIQNGSARTGFVRLSNSTSQSSNAYSLTVLAVLAGEEKIIVAGETFNVSSTTEQPPTTPTIWSYDANNGSADTSFGNGGRAVLSSAAVSHLNTVKIQNSNNTANRIMVAGTVNNHFMIARFTLTGTLDTAFNGSGSVIADFGNSNDFSTAMLIQPTDNKVVVAGFSTVFTILGAVTTVSDSDYQTLRFNTNGTLDTTFSGDGRLLDDIFDAKASAEAVAVQTDGKIIAAGGKFVARLNSDGTLDTTFNGIGRIKIPLGYIRDAVIQTDGKIVLAVEAGQNYFFVYRFNADGTPDATFDNDGVAALTIGILNSVPTALTIQPDGKIVVAGYTNAGSSGSPNYVFALVRFLVNGAIDNSFDFDGKAATPPGLGDDKGYAVAIQPDGKIVLAGSSGNGSNTDFAVIRYNPDGSLDYSFSDDAKQTTVFGTSDDVANAIVIQSNKIVIAGYSRINSTNDFAVARYNVSDGSLDTSFSGDGKLTTPIGTQNDVSNALTIQTDGKILVAGSTETTTGINDFAVARYNTDGSLDNLFGSGGKKTVDVSGANVNDLGNAIALDSSGRVIIAGQSYGIVGIVRLLGDTPLSQTYEGDVQSRPLGDGFVDSDDIQQIRRFSVGNNLPYQSNEFQRADCSPRSTSGDGFVDGDDVQQARRFSVGTDGNQIAGGPTSIPPSIEDDLLNQAISLPFGKHPVRLRDGVAAAPAAFRVDNQNTSAGSTLTVPIRVDTVGNEAGYTFSIAFDSTKLTNPTVMIGNGGGDVIFNTNNPGQIGFSVTSFLGGTIAAGNNVALVNVTFTVAANASAGTTPITFTDTPARRKASGVDPNNPITQPTYAGGTITIGGATAAGASVSGRVFTPNGRGLTGAVVILTDADGATRTARTGAFGYYRFEDVEAGQTYIFDVRSKRYQFKPQIVSLTEDLDELNFYAQP